MIRALLFDCYGTLIDWHRGFLQSAAQVLAGRVEAAPLDHLWRVWEETQFQKCQGPYKPYRTIIAESFEEALTREKIPVGKGDGEQLALRFPTWKPFPDVTPALKALKGRIPCYIVSNTDDELLNASILSMGVNFDGNMTGTRAKAYKPNPVIFQKAIEVLGLNPPETLHVAFGYRYDLRPAQALGFLTGWLKRDQVTLAPTRPDFVLGSMDELAGILSRDKGK